MDGWKDFWADYWRCLGLDPIQHLITLLTGATAMGLVWVFWAMIGSAL